MARLSRAQDGADDAAATAACEMETMRADLEKATVRNDELSSKVTKAVKKGKAIEVEKKRLEAELAAAVASAAETAVQPTNVEVNYTLPSNPLSIKPAPYT